MIPLFLQNKLFFILGLIGFLCSGCMSGGNIATKFYILNPMDSSHSLTTAPGQNDLLYVEIRSFSLPQYLERPQIVTRTNENSLRFEEFHHWGGNFRKNIMRVLGINLSQILHTPNIGIVPRIFPPPPDFRIDVTVTRFERWADNTVYFSAQWRLLCGKANKVLTTQTINLSGEVANKGVGLEHTVSAMSNLMGELSSVIGKEIIKQRSQNYNVGYGMLE